MSDQPPGGGAHTLAPGTLIGGYRIEGIAGRGGMGIVYRATQQRLRRVVALKVVSPRLAADPEFRSRFEHEAELAASIEHPNVIPVYEAGEQDGVLFLAMRYIDGTDLRQWLAEHGPMPPLRAARIISQVGDALDAAHANGLVHRDVKPGNMLLIEHGGRDHVYLTDFGLTKRSSGTAQMTKTGTWVGTVDYVAPEQVRGERVDARTDIYSLGCVLFQLLSNHLPFERDSDLSKIYAHVHEPPPSLRRFSAQLGGFDAVVGRAMAKHPNDRFASASDLGRAAVAAAELRPPELGEQSVAVGPAAPAVGLVADRDATYAGEQVPTEPLPYPARTLVDPARLPPPEPPPEQRDEALRRVALIGGPLALLVVAGVVAAILLSQAGSSSSKVAHNGPVTTSTSTSAPTTSTSTSSSPTTTASSTSTPTSSTTTSSASSTFSASGSVSGAWPTAEQNAYLQGCEKSGTETAAFCQCTLNKLMALYPASEAGTIDVNDPKVKNLIKQCLGQ